MNRQPQSVPQEILINTKVVTSQWRSPAQATQSKSSKITPTQETSPTPPTRQDAKKKEKDRDLCQQDACAEAAGPSVVPVQRPGTVLASLAGLFSAEPHWSWPAKDCLL